MSSHDASVYASLEDALVERIQTVTPEGATIQTLRQPGPNQIHALPAFVIVWDRTTVLGSETIAGVVRVNADIHFVVGIVCRGNAQQLGSGRYGESGAYQLADQLRDALLGFQPEIAGSEAVWPAVLVSEAVHEDTPGLVQIETEWTIEYQFSREAS
jgi:hypothetical protein